MLALTGLYLVALGAGTQLTFWFLFIFTHRLVPIYFLSGIGAAVLGGVLLVASAARPARAAGVEKLGQIQRIWLVWGATTVVLAAWSLVASHGFLSIPTPPGTASRFRLGPFARDGAKPQEGARVIIFELVTEDFFRIRLSCDDGVEREMVCDPLQSGGRSQCRCLANGIETKKLGSPRWVFSDEDEAVQAVNRFCGWKTHR